MRLYLLVSLVIWIGCVELRAQSTYVPLQSTSQHMLDRFEIKSGHLATPQEFNTSSKSYQRHRVATYVDSFNVVGAKLSAVDYFNLSYLQADNFDFTQAESTKSKRSYFGVYQHKAAFYAHKSADFNIMINPVTQLQTGYDTRLKQAVGINNRGIELRGNIGNKLGFFTSFTNEILTLNSWTKDYYHEYQVIPGASFIKFSDDTTILKANLNYASGYVVYQANKYIDLQFGHGKNFLGNGYRSFYMSDFSREHLFLRANTRIWKINYTNIWGQMYDWNNQNQRNLPKRHYYATTYANVNLTKSFNIGLFQTVSFQRDSGYNNGGFDYEYLNPIIFFKPIENGLNSPDKTILGGDFKWNFARHFQLYGQAVISEFKISELVNNKGWFGNKWATQFGLKYIDAFGVSNLDVQTEVNIARPYMYTSFNTLNAYVNYNQNMAHPLGANFYEGIGIIRYQPTNRLFLKATGIFAVYGNDTNGSNWGKDIRIAYGTTTLPKIYGNTITQGVKTNLLFLDFIASYMLKHNLFIEVQVTYRKTSSDLAVFNTQTILTNVGVRWNFAERRWDF